VRRERGCGSALTLRELIDEYLAQHDGEPETIEKLRWLLTISQSVRRAPATSASLTGDRGLADDDPARAPLRGDTGAQAVVARAVVWGMIGVNPAKYGVDNPQRRYTEKRPFESWADLAAVAANLGSYYGPMVLFAAATGLRPGEWIALEQRDLDREARVVYVRRAYRNGRLKCTKTQASVRSVPLQATALAALEQLPADRASALLFPSARGGHLDLHNFRNRDWKPAQHSAGIAPLRRVYDLRHTFATFALRAGISTFDLSRYMGASLTMIDRHYGHLARDGREHAIQLLDAHTRSNRSRRPRRGRSVDVEDALRRQARQPKHRLSRK
jgi:integrase